MSIRWHLRHDQLGSKPWAVQVEYLRRANGRDRYGNFSQMGLGKTAANLNEFVDFDDVDLNIVLAPSSFVGDWPCAVPEWGLSFMKTGMWPRDPLPLDWDCGLYTFAHETLRGSKRARDALLHLFKTRRCLLTLDEATAIKNPQSLLAKWLIMDLVKYATKVRLLDGTPITQTVMDYYPKLRCLGEINGMNSYAFRNRFAVMGGFQGKQVKGMRNEEELAEILNRCSFRGLKKDWRADLPPQVDRQIHLEMTDNQRRHYGTMMEDFVALVEDEEVTAELVLTQRIKLQQISSGLLIKDDRAFWLDPPEKNPKLQAVLSVAEVSQSKMIVVYFFRPSGALLIDQFSKAGYNPAWITGGMTSNDILEQKARFNNDPSCRILVGQIDQTSRGHTLIGQEGTNRCDQIFYFETSLSYYHRSQMNDRNHRGAQDSTCYLYDPVTSPVDQLNVDILTGKRNQADGMDALIKLVRSKQWAA